MDTGSNLTITHLDKEKNLCKQIDRNHITFEILLVTLDDELARRLSALNICVRAACITQAVDLVNENLDLFRRNHVEQLVGVAVQIGAVLDVAVDDRAHELDVLGGQVENADGRNGAGLRIVS